MSRSNPGLPGFFFPIRSERSALPPRQAANALRPRGVRRIPTARYPMKTSAGISRKTLVPPARSQTNPLFRSGLPQTQCRSPERGDSAERAAGSACRARSEKFRGRDARLLGRYYRLYRRARETPRSYHPMNRSSDSFNAFAPRGGLKVAYPHTVRHRLKLIADHCPERSPQVAPHRLRQSQQFKKFQAIVMNDDVEFLFGIRNSGFVHDVHKYGLRESWGPHVPNHHA